MPQSALNMPHRLSRGSPKGASAGMSLARDEKCATAARVGLNTSRQPCKIAGEDKTESGDGKCGHYEGEKWRNCRNGGKKKVGFLLCAGVTVEGWQCKDYWM